MTIPENLQEFLNRSSLAPRAGLPVEPSGSLAVPSGGSSSSGPLSVLMGGLDLLQRPMRAVSEAYGEFQEDDDILEGMIRGLTGEYEHGTLGEQLLPKAVGSDYDAAEEWGKKAARLAIDIATDPLTYLALGPARGMIGAGLRGAKAVAKKLPIPQWMAIAALPSLSVVRRYGAEPGKLISRGINRGYVASKAEAGLIEDALKKQVWKTGLHKRGTKRAREDATHWIEEGYARMGIGHTDERVTGLAQHVYETFQTMGGKAEKFKDNFGKGFMVAHPTLASAQIVVKELAQKYGLSKGLKDEMWQKVLRGESANSAWGKGTRETYQAMKGKLKGYDQKVLEEGPSLFKGEKFYVRPFKLRKDYTPHMLREEVLETLGTTKGFSKGVEELAKLNNISKSEAKKVLENFATPQKAGQLEYAREFKMPELWIERDPLKYLPRYTEKLFNRMEFGREFGLSGERLEKLISGAVDAGLDSRFAGEFSKIAMGQAPRNMTLDRLARKVMAVQVFTKMGPLSTLANLTQNTNTAITYGGVNFLRGVMRSQTDEGARAGVVAYQRGIHDMLMRLTGGESSWANRYLEWVGFNPIERANRLWAANAGIVSTERAIMQAGKMTDDLARRGVTNDDILKVVANEGKMPLEVADRIGLLASEATQHATHWKDIPLWWQSPVWRVAFQYKSFVYQQTRFLMREVMVPANKYFTSGGKKGSIAPLLRAAAGFGIGAQAVSFIRQNVRKQAGKLVGIEYEPPEFDEQHPFWQLFQKSMYVGGVGIAGDLVERSMQRDLKGWFLGPTVGDISDLVEGGFNAMRAAAREDEEVKFWKAGAEAQRRLPFVGTLLPRGKETTEKWEELGGYVR